VPEHSKITIAGRAVLFPQNVGVPAGTTLTIWRVKDSTGERIAHQESWHQGVCLSQR
jgi:hypothetical protein